MELFTSQEEKELLNRLSSGDEAAFSLLFRTYHGKLYSFVLALTRNEATAEDIIQDVFMKIWTHRAQAADVLTFNAFIYRMAKNAAIDQLRRVARENILLPYVQTDLYVSQPLDPFQSLSVSELKRRIDEAVSELPKQQRLVYKKHHYEGVEQEEIAREMNLSVSTIRNHLMHAMNRIRKAITLFSLLVFLLRR